MHIFFAAQAVRLKAGVWRFKSLLNGTVTIAESNIALKSFTRETIDIGGVVQPAVLQKIDGEIAGKEHVYDLTVECAHEYFANGILVHNCMDSIRYSLYSHYAADS